ncbi:MAG: nitroreductase family protein [Planctomycetota bacterium]|jgi:nitroreductase
MEFLDALRARRSVKAFDPTHRLSDEEMRHLMAHVALTPTSFNMQNWHFVVVTDQEVQDRLCAASWNQAQVKEASVTILVAGNLKGHENMERTLRKAPEEVKQMFGGMVPGFYSNPEICRDEALRTAGLAGMSLMLLAKDMGYDSCPMIGFDPAKVAEIVELPEDHPPLLMITIGKALRPAHGRMGLLDLEEFVSMNRFGNHAMQGEVDDSTKS